MTNYPTRNTEPQDHVRKAFRRWVLVAFGIVGSLLAANVLMPRQDAGGDRELAMEAIKLLKDWCSWMAGVLTATLAALGVLAKDGLMTRSLSKEQTNFLAATVVFIVFALFFSAWLLTATSSLVLRIQVWAGTPWLFPPPADIYNLPLYQLFPSWLTVGFFAACNHWLWGASIIAFGMLAATTILQESASTLTASGDGTRGRSHRQRPPPASK